MEGWNETFKTIVFVIVAMILTFLIIYGGYWIIKKVSYSLFYEDMVKQTITEMVKPDSLK